MSEIQSFIRKLTRQEHLTAEEASRAFQIILLGGATPAQIASILTALRMKGEITDELIGAARVIQSKSGKIRAPENTIDICGTGSNGPAILNVSTAAALVVAAGGTPVAKHGNRALTATVSSADVLTYLGVNTSIEPATAERCLEQVGICFLVAPAFHKAMRHILPIGEELGIRTVFNLLGPLANPARTKYQLFGVYHKHWLEPLALTLKELGSKRVWIVHGGDGLDEISTTCDTHVLELHDGVIKKFTISPAELGIEPVDITELYGSNVAYNAEKLKQVLKGDIGPFRDIVLLNAAACFVITGKTAGLPEGIAYASEVIDSGKAIKLLEQLVTVTR